MGYIKSDTVLDKEINPLIIIAQIKSGDENSLKSVYGSVYPMVEKYILENSGSKDDARDIFQDTMYIFLKRLELNDFELTSKLSTFLFGIAKNLWLKKLTKKNVDEESYKNEIVFENTEEDDYKKLTRVKLIKKSIDLLGEPCQTILVQYYYFKQTMKEIAQMLHYTNADNAKNQKYKCLIRLKKMISKEEVGK